ncbi:MAG: hypothetical protein ABUT20_00970 [Bacteroidota bacterium]
MQFEDFDKRIIDAAEHHHPAYEEKAWEKMETLLDKHMPVKKDDRRRIIFFLFLFVSIGSGAFLLFRGGSSSQVKKQVAEQQIKDSKVAPVSIPSSDTKNGNPTKIKQAESETAVKEVVVPVDKNNNSEPVEQAANAPANNNATSSVADKADKIKTSNAVVTKEIEPAFKSKGKSQPLPANNNNGKKIKSANSLTNKSTGDAAINSVADGSVQKNTTITSDAVLNPNQVTQEVDQKSETTKVVNFGDTSLQKKSEKQDIKPAEKNSALASKKENKKAGKQKQFPLAFTFSAGPDLSFISLSQIGKTTMRYGAGLSYTVNRFTLRSGFYVSRKVYSAEGYNYHPFYANLERVDGDCKVFDIPVTINYNFLQKKNYNLFASAGLSSYLMKKETYDYLSKDPSTGTPYYNTRTWSDKNKHYFSVLNVSAGYERKFTNAISVIAEPYLQIPLTGIGNGKMKLNSAGLLFTLSVKPFSGKK